MGPPYEGVIYTDLYHVMLTIVIDVQKV